MAFVTIMSTACKYAQIPEEVMFITSIEKKIVSTSQTLCRRLLKFITSGARSAKRSSFFNNGQI